MEQRKIIMDCDPGIDDAMALAYAASRPDAFKILAVTTVAGNQELQKVTANALDLTAFYGLDTEVAAGMSQPLINKLAPATDYHGENGLGNCVLPGSEKQAVEEMAVFYIRRKLMELPENEKATLVCTAPLTNIAMLLKLFPEVKSRICEIIFMGGSASGGNVTASAEFNIYTDPEAAKIVFGSGVPLVMCGLDVTEKCVLTASQIAKLAQSGNKIAHFCGEMGAYSLDHGNKYKRVVRIHDAVPFMYLTHPEIFEAEKAVLDVECSDCASRGRTICDFRWWREEELESNNLVLMRADSTEFQKYLIEGLYELGEMVKGN